MHRQTLLNLLADYEPLCDWTRQCRDTMVTFVNNTPDCFERSHAAGHITASAWVLNLADDKALLTLHRKLGIWIQLGGHADGDSDLHAVALKEVEEESGLTAVQFVEKGIFDIDIHTIPARPNEPEHLHYDVTFLLQQTAEQPLIISDESLDLQWFSKQAMQQLPLDQSVERLVRLAK